MPTSAAGSAPCRGVADFMSPLVDLPETLTNTLPKSRGEIECIQSQRKKLALAQARRAPFYQGKLGHVDADRLDDPDEWRKIPILDKERLRKLGDREFYEHFCIAPDDGIAEYCRSGGSTGTPLFYPRSYGDIAAAMIGFARIYALIMPSALTRAREAAPIPTSSEADRPAPAGWVALWLLADVDISF
jgi:phenylacetate-coenzyme A ligase PaaK-like adenylate-forming protein